MIPRPRRRSGTLIAVAVAVAVAFVGCGAPATSSTTPPAQPSVAPSTGVSATPPIPGLSWVTAEADRPDEAFAEPSAQPTGPSGPGTAGHPGHFPGQAIVDDVVAGGDGLVAVGYVGIDGVWTAIAWHSTDGRRWTLESIDDAPGSFAVAVAADPARGAAVAGGRSGPRPVVWTRADDGDWTRAELPTLEGGDDWERVVAIAATPDGLLAGGSAGPELGDRRARFWRSTDAAGWVGVPDDDAFAGGEVVAIAPRPSGGFVALGRLGTGQRSTGSVAWLSDDGASWRRVDDAALAGGLVNGLATDRDGSLVAVGSDPDEREAAVWRSVDDGATWQRAPREAARLYEPYKIRMTDVVATPGGLVAVGNRVGLQYGAAASWLAADDWRTWRRSGNDPSLGQGEMLAVAPGGPGLVAVGSFGAPDNYVPTIWSTRAPGG